MYEFTIISAMDRKRGIGKNNDLPWHFSADMKHFVQQTKGGTVIMGRKTWESIPPKYRPFKDRLNIVLTRRNPWDFDLPDGVLHAPDLDIALSFADNDNPDQKIFIIGGASVYEQTITDPRCTELILTQIDAEFDCDVFFPEIPVDFKISNESALITEKETNIKFISYSRPA